MLSQLDYNRIINVQNQYKHIYSEKKMQASGECRNMERLICLISCCFFVRCPQMACRFAQKISRHVQKACG